MSVKCQYVAFKLAAGKSVDKAAVITALLAQNCKTNSRGGRERYTWVGKSGDYLVGRWMGFNGKNRSVVADTSTREMIWNELPPGLEHTAPNYFVFSTKTFHGIYQKYKGSNSLNHFGGWFLSVAADTVRADKKAALAHANTQRKARRRLSTKEAKKKAAAEDRERINEDFTLDFGPVIHPEKLEALLARWQSINGLRYKVFVPTASAAEYGPIAPHTHAAVHELIISTSHADVTRKAGRPDTKFGRVVADTLAWLKARYKGDLKRTSLIGTDQNGVRKTVNLDRYTDTLDQDEIDKALTDSELSNQNVVDSPLVGRMLSLCHERPEYFKLESR